jgi:hypothetical protein
MSWNLHQHLGLNILADLTEEIRIYSSTSGVDIEYNQKAIESASKAASLFKEHKAEGLFTDDENDYNGPKKMKKLARLLSGWDTTKLTYYTNMYITSVYSEIFSKLKPESRPIITQMMLESKSK